MKKLRKRLQSKKSKPLSQYILFTATILFVLLSSLFFNTKVRTFLSQASEATFNMSPTMKNKRLDLLKQNNVEQSSEQSLETETMPGQTLPNQSQSTATPRPVPTTATSEPLCKMDSVVTQPNCTCPDLLGVTCTGEKTQGYTNYYYLPRGAREATTDTNGQYVAVKGKWLYRQSNEDYARKKQQSNCIEWCIGKPVIYLYPETSMYVNVEVFVPGRIFISDPIYPEGGWKQVLAYPDGNLDYQGKHYRELYYETALNTDLRTPTNGLLIATDQLSEKLSTYTQQLGLNEFESSEFNEYWIPHLQELNAPYILFSILEEDEKERIDTVKIDPAPDTFIAFLAYFKPVYEYYKPLPLILPQSPPERIGFTAVEWGGTIDIQAIQ